MRYLVAVALLLVFFLSGVVAWLFALGALAFGQDGIRYSANIVHALDCVLAAILGYEGDKTVSKECATRDSAFCRALCKFLSAHLETDHCPRQKR